MIPYIFIFVVGLFCTALSLISRKIDNYTFTLFFFIVLLFIGLRYDGIDYFGYWGVYEAVRESGYGGFGKEYGFALLMLVEQFFLGHFFWFVFLFAALSLAVKFKAIKALSPYLTLALFIYVSSALFWKDLGQIRNGFVAGMVLLSVIYAQRKDSLRFFIVVFLAVQIHLVTIIAFLIYFINHLKSRFFLFLMVITSFLIGLFGGVGELAVSYLSIGFDGTLVVRAVSYVGSEFQTQRNILGLSSIVNLLVMLFIIYNYKKLVSRSPFNAYLIPVAALGISIDYLFSDFGIMGSRVFDIFYSPSIVILLSYIYTLVQPRFRWMTFSALIIYCATSFSYLMLASSVPYKSIIGL